MTGCIIGSVACGFIVGVIIVALIGSASLRSREDEMRAYFLSELERIKHEREKDNDLLGRDSNGDPAAPEAMRVRMEQQLSEGHSGSTTDCP